MNPSVAAWLPPGMVSHAAEGFVAGISVAQGLAMLTLSVGAAALARGRGAGGFANRHASSQPA